VLHPPAPPRSYRCDGYGDFLFFVSRLEPLKRADLAIRAMAEPAARGVRLVIGGDGPERERLQTLARELNVDSRVTFLGHVDEPSLLDHLGRCRAVVFTPRDEDYGFVTVEAFESAKAVITCRDSGGPTELVTADSGLVVESTAAGIGAACGALAADAALAERLGQQAKRQVASLTWPSAVDRLVLR
jgi:glycosyltransferase involved in cell wall biosynthesis